MSKIKILHLRDSHGIYGAERVILTLAKHIDRSRFEFILLCLQAKEGVVGGADALITEAQKIGITVEVVPVKGRLDLRAIRDIRRILRKHSISILHTHDFKTTFYALLASMYLGIRRVVTAHGSTRDSILMRLYLLLDERIIYRFFHKIIAVADHVSTDLREKGIKPDRTVVIHNAIDLPPDSKTHCPQPPSSDSNGNKVFGVIGRLFPDKGHRLFLEAFHALLKTHPSAKALIVGGGPLESKLSHQIRDLNLENNVSLCGVRPDIHNVYRHLDFIVIPSLREGLPYVLLEALANRIPVLATAVGDIPRLIEHEKTGYLVPPANAHALEHYMRALLTAPDHAKQMAANGHRLVAAEYSARQMVQSTQLLYESLVNSYSPPFLPA